MSSPKKAPALSPFKRFLRTSFWGTRATSMKRMSYFRSKWFLGLFVLMYAALIVRVAWINFAPTEHSGSILRAEALATREQVEPLNPLRGNIYDRNGKPLAVSTQAETVMVIPSLLKDLEVFSDYEKDKSIERFTSLETLAAKLSTILDMSWKSVWDIITSEKNTLYLARQITAEQAEQIRILRLQGISFLYEPKRYYPLNQFASTFMGFVGIDNHGLAGLEYWYDELLYGQAGKMKAMRSSDGSAMPLYDSKVEEPVNGTSLVLTIDEQLQTILERELSSAVKTNLADSGGALIMDPYTGEILAMAAIPNYNPNEFAESDPELWVNPLVSEAFEPGSTFKIITCLAALHEGIASENEMYQDPGYYQIGADKIWNWDKGADHGVVSLLDAMRNSSNVVLGQLGLRLGADRLIAFQQLMGFGEQTGIDYPGESLGLLFDPTQIKDIEIFTNAFGQGPSVTPLQQLNAINAIVNGGHLLKPRLVKATIDTSQTETPTPMEEIRTVASEETMRRMREILEYVINAPGSNGASKLFTLAGKTGTANKFNPETGRYYEDKYIASTIGFAPSDQPKYSIYIYLDNPHGPNGYYGGQTAAPAFKRIAEEILKISGYLPNELTQAEISTTSPSVLPEYRGRLWEDVKKDLKEETKIQVFGYGSQVAAQYPASGSEFSSGQVLHFYLSEPTTPESNQIAMPNLVGKSLVECVSVTQQMNLVLVTTGTGTCISQSTEAGKMVTKGSSVRANFN